MRARQLSLPTLLASLVLGAAVISYAAEDGQPAPSGPAAQEGASGPAAPGQTVQETNAQGSLPDLAGRWLAVGWIELPGGGRATIPMFWEVASTDGKPVLTQRFVDLPPPLKQVFDKSNSDQELWKPTPDDLARIAGDWANLPRVDSHVAHVKSDILGRDAFDDPIKNEPRSKDSQWVARQRWDFDGKAGALARQVLIFSTMDKSGTDYTGNLDGAMVAAAPFPIPIAFKGTFQLYRLSEPPPRGFLARLFDFFAGCGRARQGG
jgi:hypothetical protein